MALRSWPASGVSEPLTASHLRLPIRYTGLNGERLHAILPHQFGPTMSPLSLWTA